MFEQYRQTPVEFSSLEEFLNIDFIKSRMNVKDFVQFSRDDKDKYLMVEYLDKFYVCGYLKDATEEFLSNFPLFDITKYNNEQ